ncbi:exonuclease subunit SbcD [Blastococcus sp. TML/C7B]|uniref:metallophosphoesterase family protein n=1 Tax=Blastococcus sp. TML/C7B TaxID=2798728 RepID=UPI001F5B274A|nr:exonuclease subunit SbcD [Blastococcus sp. TML/C7B]
MRLLHTSDWHIGRTLHGTDLLAEQEAVLGGLAEVVVAESVDVVVVAGDVYDRAVPSADATAVLDRVVGRLLTAGAQVVLTPGNHDSARRLGTFSGLLAVAGLHVRAVTPALDEPVLLSDEHGEVAVYGIPYLEPEVARHELGLAGRGEAAVRGHEGVLSAAMERIRADLFLRPGARSVVLAHAFVGGGLPSESERDICVGGVDLVPAGDLRRRGLRRAGAPAPAADAHPAAALQRLAAGLLLRRGGAAEAGLAGRARRGRPGRRPARAAADAPAALDPHR